LVLGPFFPEDLETDFLTSANGETFANPKPGDTVTTAEGKTLTWTVYRTEGNLIDLHHAVGNYQEAVCYAFCLLESDQGGDGELLVGSDDGVVVFLNGQRVHTHPVRRAIVVDQDRVPVSLRPGKNRCLMKISNGAQDWALTTRVLPPTRAVIAGIITDESRKTLANVPVHLWQNSTMIAKTETDAEGFFQFSVYPATGLYDIQATLGNKGNWEMGVQLSAGDRAKMNITLEKAISISGNLLALDNNTPNAGVLVEAILIGEDGASQKRATTLSDSRGRYQFINLIAGSYQVRCHTWDTHNDNPYIIAHVDLQNTVNVNIDFHFPPFKQGTWKHYTYLDGLGSNHVRPIYQDREGFLWFGTNNGGVSQYDGEKFVNFTTDDGLADNSVWAIYQDRDGYLWFGTLDNGVSRYDGEKFVNFTTNEGFTNDFVSVIHEDQKGHLWFGTNGGVSHYDGEEFVNFTTNNGLVSNLVRTIHQDQDGFLWFGFWDGGVSRYDGEKFINFTTDDGLADNSVWNIIQDRAGDFWVSSPGKGISQYDSSGFINFTTADGLVDNVVYTVYQDREGLIWFGTEGGISKYDGEKFINFTTDDGLVANSVWAIHQDRDGYFWFGTDNGISRYDGVKFVNFTTDDGLAFNQVWVIHQDREGYLWFGTSDNGISRYDGEKFVNFRPWGMGRKSVTSIYQDREGSLWFGISIGGIYQYRDNQFVNFTTDDGLTSNSVWVIHQDREGYLWFGARGGDGVSRYDGEKFINFTTNDGLAENDVASIYQDQEGSLWFGTHSGGVSRYDGTSWTSLDTRDGLINNHVLGITQDADGKFWIGTLEGVTQYNPNRVPPSVRIVSVQSHKTSTQTGSLETIKDITTDTRVTIKYSSIDFKTVKEKRQYQVRIKEIDSDWREPTRSDTFNISFDKPGTYTFEVVAIDRDLNYSAPASLTLTVVLPWFQNGWILYPSGGAIVVLLLLCGIFAYRYYQQRQQVLTYQREAVSELADAKEMQLGLIPQTAPEVPGFEIAGVCISARTVSGDFFDYVPLGNGTLAVVLADVTGKGMKGAMNAILSSGALHSVAKLEMSPSEMLWALNQNLYPRFQQYTNCAMAILTIDPKDKTLKYANAGIPYPIIKHGEDDTEELLIDGLPLGAFKSSEYQETPPIELKSGNLIILFSDGITEASQSGNPDQLYMETDRLTHLIKGLDKTMNADAVVEAIINDVRDFSGDAQQNDDMTIVVIKAL
ncbi:MAG: SpoIIE family protein phosphatase, partial [Candidatus Poribacteria bacterium]|nr:SpoIIE family protein phosphatase [Candidatus Poribacteria bacterium]